MLLTPGPRALPLTAVALAALLLAACDSGPAPTATTAAPSVTTAPAAPTTPAPGSSATGSSAPATASTAPSVTGPATPTAPPGSFAIAVAGAGQVTYPVTAVTCAPSAVTVTATPTGGGAPGTLTLDTADGVLTVAGLPPLDGTRLAGRVDGTPVAGVTVRWTGDGTGAAASLTVTCP